MKSRTTGQVLYLYGITREGGEKTPPMTGVDGSCAVETVSCSGLACWISRVDKKEFADNLAANMEALEWLAEVSVRHQQVVAAIATVGDILPARFGTVFRSQASLEADIARQREVLERDLQRVSGCEEWGVKVFGVQSQTPATDRAKSGRDYLQAKAAALHAAPGRATEAELQRLVGALEEVAVENAPGGGPVSRGQRGLQWQGSLLVKRSQRSQLQQLAARFSREWEGTRRIELSGPWPPYSFVSRSRETGAGRS